MSKTNVGTKTDIKPMSKTNVGANLMFALRTKTDIKSMSKTNVGANLVFALRTKTDIKPMFENELETIASDINSKTIVVRRANIRFALH